MKKILFLIAILATINCKAQILPVEQYVFDTDEEEPTQLNGITHVKDVNGVLNKFIGTWKGSFNGNNYEFVVTKITDTYPEGLKWDVLRLRYKITGQAGVIINTLTLPNDNYLVASEYFLQDNTTYVFDYQGIKTRYGENGFIYFNVTTSNKGSISYYHRGEGLVEGNCIVDCSYTNLFPLNDIINLTKQ